MAATQSLSREIGIQPACDAFGIARSGFYRGQGPAMAPAPRPSEPTLDVTRATLRQLDISDGEVSFFDARRGAGWVVGDVDISSDLSNLEQPMRVAGEVLFNEKPVELDIEAVTRVPGYRASWTIMGGFGSPTRVQSKWVWEVDSGDRILFVKEFDGLAGQPVIRNKR